MKDKKTDVQILRDLKNKQEKQIKLLETELKLKSEFKTLGIDFKRVYIADKSKRDKYQLIGLDLTNIKDLKTLLKIYKPVDMWYIDNTFTSDLSKWEAQSVTMQDGKVLNGVEYQKTKNKFFKCGLNIGVDVENSSYGENEIKIEWHTKKFNFWVKIPFNLINEEMLSIHNEVDTHETEKARKYNYRHQDIYKRVSKIKDVKCINFWGGMKRHFITNNEEKKIIKSLLKV